jgi:3-methyladenine DNA glycosylase AlkC
MKTTGKLKDWYDQALVVGLADRFGQSVRNFDRARFIALATDGLDHLEMMDRVRRIAGAMVDCFPGPTADDMRALIESMGPALPNVDNGTGMVGSSYPLWPFGEFIGRRGLDDWPAAWRAMEELTQRLTSEFAVRPFLAADLEQSLARLESLLSHPSHHVRRWVSEGTRTRLPWAKAVPVLLEAQDRRLAFLERLKDDPSPYVRRSVANHLQDILKDDVEAGLEVLERWSALNDPPVDWVVKHAARGLLKSGHPRALALFGWNTPLSVDSFSVGPTTVALGEAVDLVARLSSPAPLAVPVRVDFCWQGPTASGRRFRKVFCWSQGEIAGLGTLALRKSHPFLERSTRKLPGGCYDFTLLVNGQAMASCTVELLAEGAVGPAAEPLAKSLLPDP